MTFNPDHLSQLERRALERRRLDPDATEAFRRLITPRHSHLSPVFLDPRLLPVELLLAPEHWEPKTSGLEISQLEVPSHELLTSGALEQVLRGQRRLVPDLPPIDLRAYASELRKSEKMVCRQQRLSAFEHLVGRGRYLFRRGEPLGKGIDRYQSSPASACGNSDVLTPAATEQLPQVLVVLMEPGATCPEVPWDTVLPIQLDALDTLKARLPSFPEALVSFIHHSDHLTEGASGRIAETAACDPEAALITSDECEQWSASNKGNRQNRVALTPLRLLCRGAIGGVVTVRLSVLRQLIIPVQRLCSHNLFLDLALQLAAREARFGHCPYPLLARSIQLNPSVLDVAAPMERWCFSADQETEMLAIVQQRGRALLHDGGALLPVEGLPGCFQLQYRPPVPVLVSVLIPFRDGLALTRACVDSFRRCAGSVPYELILIDNGSQDADTLDWLAEQRCMVDVQVLRLDFPFNYARLHNLARPYCRGTHLLLLNNDIECRSDAVLERLLDPLAFRGTHAVGSRLLYPDGSIQHQGIRLVSGERRSVQEPGKYLRSPEVINCLTPLRVQEPFSAATAACLLIPCDLFDAVGGFDEEFAVVFNDVDLCLRLLKKGGTIAVTPYPWIIHHESISRGKDLEGAAYARHQRESGLLHQKHADLFEAGDPLTSRLLHPHGSQYQPRDPDPLPSGLVQERVCFEWRRRGFRPQTGRPLLLFAHFATAPTLRPDLWALLREYQRHADIVFISACPDLHHNPLQLIRLKRRCAMVITRHNEGYDFGSWMTGWRRCANDVAAASELILTNDSFWGPITPLDDLFSRIRRSSADVIGLTDDLMYEPHLQSAFLVYRRKAFTHPCFQTFWQTLGIWDEKRDLIKYCEVGLTAMLKRVGLKLESLYTNQAYGNVLHFFWKSLITEQSFPFLKVSLLRDNPTGQPIDDWEQVVGARNPRLARQIARALREAHVPKTDAPAPARERVVRCREYPQRRSAVDPANRPVRSPGPASNSPR